MTNHFIFPRSMSVFLLCADPSSGIMRHREGVGGSTGQIQPTETEERESWELQPARRKAEDCLKQRLMLEGLINSMKQLHHLQLAKADLRGLFLW